mgnify:FL=1
MNNRLQVGGLALVIKAENPKNLGVVVKLVSRDGYYDWKIEGDLDKSHLPIELHNRPFACYSDQLMPLGDKQTQDELAKEKGLEDA